MIFRFEPLSTRTVCFDNVNRAWGDHSEVWLRNSSGWIYMPIEPTYQNILSEIYSLTRGVIRCPSGFERTCFVARNMGLYWVPKIGVTTYLPPHCIELYA